MDGFNMILPIDKFLPTNVERPDILDIMYQPTEILTTLGIEEFNKIPIHKEYLNNSEEREQRKLQYAKEAEERFERLKQLEKETDINALSVDENNDDDQITNSER